MFQIGHHESLDYVITADDTLILAKDKKVKICCEDTKDGLYLMPAWTLGKYLTSIEDNNIFAIVYETRADAEQSLSNMRLDLEKHFGKHEWKVAHLKTIHLLETDKEYIGYGTKTKDN